MVHPSSRCRPLVRAIAAAVAVGILVAACGSSTPDPSPLPVPSGQAHPTGAADVILRLDESGGATSPTLLAVQPPTFTLYGDGTVLYRNLSHDARPKWLGPSVAFAPFKSTKLTETQVQALLADAVADGGLGRARSEYTDPRIDPTPTAIFTINADGIRKTVSVSGLDTAITDGADAADRAAFLRLAERWRSFGEGVNPPGEAWAPARYRAFLSEDPSGGVVPARPWPWADLRPTDFISPGGLADGVAVISDVQARLLAGDGYQGGLMGFSVAGPGDGKTYALQLRPLLPDESP